MRSVEKSVRRTSVLDEIEERLDAAREQQQQQEEEEQRQQQARGLVDMRATQLKLDRSARRLQATWRKRRALLAVQDVFVPTRDWTPMPPPNQRPQLSAPSEPSLDLLRSSLEAVSAQIEATEDEWLFKIDEIQERMKTTQDRIDAIVPSRSYDSFLRMWFEDDPREELAALRGRLVDEAEALERSFDARLNELHDEAARLERSIDALARWRRLIVFTRVFMIMIRWLALERRGRRQRSLKPAPTAFYYYETPTPVIKELTGETPRPNETAQREAPEPDEISPPRILSLSQATPCALHERRRRGERWWRRARGRRRAAGGECEREGHCVRVAYGEGEGRSRSGPTSIHW